MEKHPLFFFFLLFAAFAFHAYADNYVVTRKLVTKDKLKYCNCKVSPQIQCIHVQYKYEADKPDKNDYICQCVNGWSGKDCKTVEENECLKPEVCDRRTSTCISRLKGSYRCLCRDGFEPHGTLKHVCNETNECANPDNNPCSVNGPNEMCINTFGSYRCECKQGFVRTDGKCVKKMGDECPSNQFMDTKSKRCRCRKTIARYNDGDICFDCNKNSIGLSQHSKFPDYAFVATSLFSWIYAPSRVRSRSATSWSIEAKKVNKSTGVVKGNQYIEIDLRTRHFICAIAVGPSKSEPKEFVSTYKIAYQQNAKATTWTIDPKIYRGATIAASHAFSKVILPERPLMRKIRIYPKTCNKGRDCSMRLELYGQRVDENGECTMNADKETFKCKCNAGYVGDGSTCRAKEPHKLIGKAGVDRYTYGQVLSVRGNLVKFLPENAKRPVFGERFYDYAMDIIPDASRVRQFENAILFRTNPSSKEFFWGIVQSVDKGVYRVRRHITIYDYKYYILGHKEHHVNKTFHVKLDDIRVFERNPDVCNQIPNSVYVSGDYPGSYSCLCPFAGELPSDKKCVGKNKFFVTPPKVDSEQTYKFTEASIKYINGNRQAILAKNDVKAMWINSADIFNAYIETPYWYTMAYGDSAAGIQKCTKRGCPTTYAFGWIKHIGYQTVVLRYGIYEERFNLGKISYANPQNLILKTAQCPINSTVVLTEQNVPSSYSCACNGPIIDNVCTKPIDVMSVSNKRGPNATYSDLPISRLMGSTSILLGEHLNDGFRVELNLYDDQHGVLENIADTTMYSDDAPYWLRNTARGGEGLYSLGHVGGRLLGEDDSVVFVRKDAPKGKSRFTLAKRENVFKERRNGVRSMLYGCREDNLCGKPGQGICISKVWNFHRCVCAEGFKNFWGPKGETCVPNDYN